MSNCKYSLPIVIVGMLIFTILCNSRVDVPSEVLVGFLALLHVGMIWLAITIFKDSEPPVQNGGEVRHVNLNDK